MSLSALIVGYFGPTWLFVSMTVFLLVVYKSLILVRAVFNKFYFRLFRFLKFLFVLFLFFFNLQVLVPVLVKQMVTIFVFILVLVTKIALAAAC